MASTRLEELFEWRDQDRQRKARAVTVIKGKQLQAELNPHGLMKWYLHPNIDETVIKSLLIFVQEIPPGSKTGKLKFQGNGWQYILEGRGYTMVNGERIEWRAEDLVMLPNPPEGCTFQSFNLDPNKPARFICASPNVLHALGPDVGSGLEQLEPAPEWSERKDGKS